MPSPLSVDWQNQIVRECGDPNGTLVGVIANLWDAFASHALTNLDLQVLYTKRACLDIRLAEEQPDTDLEITDHANEKRSQRFAHLLDMRTNTQTEIVRIEALFRAERRPVAGAISTTTPTVPPDALGPDANDQRYRGDVYTPGGVVRWP